MKITPRVRRNNRLQRGFTVVLLVAVVITLGVLSQQTDGRFDWSHGDRGSLSEPSRSLLESIDAPIRFTVFLGENAATRERVRGVIERYQVLRPGIELEFVDPDLSPEQARAYGVRQAGAVFVQVGEQREAVEAFTEPGITNAIARASRGSERFVAFIEGHGEADPNGQANHDMGRLGRRLAERGLQPQRVSLTDGAIPDNTAALVIAGPREDWLPGEIERVREWVAEGGNLLWLVDPFGARLDPLAETLGIGLPDATVRDETGRQVNIDDPSLVLIYQYGDNPVTQDIQQVSLLAHSTMIQSGGMSEWSLTPILETSGSAWLEDGDGNRLMTGPFHLGQLMTRPVPGEDGSATDRDQRVAVIGSAAFLSNAFIGNGSNLELGSRLFTWVSADPVQLSVPVRSAPDRELDLSETAYTTIGGFFLFVLPGLFLLAGILVWWRRRR